MNREDDVGTKSKIQNLPLKGDIHPAYQEIHCSYRIPMRDMTFSRRWIFT